MFASSWNWIVDEIVRPLEPATVLIQMILFGIAGALFMRHRLQNISQSDKARIEQLKNQITFEEKRIDKLVVAIKTLACLLYTSPSPRDRQKSRMPSSA